MRFFLIFSLLFLVSCGEEPSVVESVETETPPMQLVKSSYADLPGWNEDAMHEAVPALVRSCGRILKRKGDESFGPLTEAGNYAVWQAACAEFAVVATGSSEDIRGFFEAQFTPFQILEGDKAEGLFTGYYEAALKGSRQKSQNYPYPLHKRPDDLVMVDLGQFRESMKGERIAGRVIDGNLKPYEARSDIVAGNWPHNDEAFVWVSDAVDAFFLQIQGSGRIELEGGGHVRAGYAGQNGHPYFAIGRELIARGELTKENVSMQSIRAWLAANPGQADSVMNLNKSYVFFQELDGEGPLGGENVALTPRRSLAIDRSLLPYGLPIWVDIAEPVAGYGALQRLMVAQDTGGAIRGAVRGDVFWGYGAEEEMLAGNMKSKGRYWALLPNALNAPVSQDE